MLPRVTVAVLLAAAALVAGGCGRPDSPEQQVRAVVAAGESAAESRDLAALMDLVAEDYLDADGLGRDELRNYLRGYLLAHPSISLVTRIESLDFPYRDMARLRLTVGMLGHGEGAGAALDAAADLHEVQLELVQQDGDWRVRRSAHRSTFGN
ncbi:MAG TPA: hypothetical protein VLM41_01655 [Steroidobacteraceae bacterium]|nr:hypothetical protein [Steroidobacteraceae bacterium]